MKNLILSTLLVALSFPVFAKEPENEATVLKENCRIVSLFAELAMKFRQAGKPIQEALSKASGIRKNSTSFADIYEDIVVYAYTKTRFSTTEYRINAVNDFASDAYVGCMTANDGIRGAK